MYITVVEARNLKAADSNGKSDPYVKLIDCKGLHIRGNSIKTEVIKKTLNPVWNQSWTLECNHKLSVLEFRVYDWDRFSADDEIGRVYVPVDGLMDQREHEQWYPLSPKGELKLKLKMELGFPVLAPRQVAVINKQSGQQLVVGLGWDQAPGRSSPIDLDASVIGYSIKEIKDSEDNTKKALNKEDVVSFRHLRGFNNAIVHSGDNRTGEGSGDDEEISIDVAALPQNVEILAFVINSFTGQRFSDIQSAYVRCRLKDQRTKHTYAYARFGGQGLNGTGLLIGYMYRYNADEWCFRAAKEVCASGRTAEDLVATAAKYVEDEYL